MAQYTITNQGDSNAEIVRELTDAQYSLLLSIADELNDAGPCYSPNLYIEPVAESEN